MKARLRHLAALVFAGALAGCATTSPNDDARILVIGDSILAWHGATGGSAADALARALNEPVDRRAKSTSRFTTNIPRIRDTGGEIRTQYRPGNYEWVVLNGGANDLRSECGCRRCDATLTDLIDANGQNGAIPELVTRIRGDGARVLVLGYYFTDPDRPTPFTPCRDEVAELNDRFERLAARDAGVYFAPSSTVIDPKNQADFFVDSIHPSRPAAARIGRLMAGIIAEADGITIAD